jgi:hypothetical protein
VSTETPSRLAAIKYDRGFDIDAFLGAVAQRLVADGLRLGGVLQSSTGPHGDCAARIQIADLATGERHDIWEERGACASGCRLDERGLVAAAPAIQSAIAAGVDLIILNRFGRAESRGGGLLSSLVAAIDSGIPVLTAIRPPYDEAWRAFHGGLAVDLEPSEAAVMAWRAALPCVAEVV